MTPPSGVRATARITAAPDGRGGTALPVLLGDGPLAPRRTWATGTQATQARVTVVGAMSAPLGGDRLALNVTVEPGARLRVGSAAATVALPGRTGDHATYDIHLTVHQNAELHWLPEPLISVEGSDLRLTTRIDLSPGARLILREELILGRTAEPPGRLSARLHVRLGDGLLLDQEIALGPGAPAWSGPAVLHAHRATGQLLVVDPAYEEKPPPPEVLSTDPTQGEAILTPLPGPATLLTAAAPDGLRLRRLLTHPTG